MNAFNAARDVERRSLEILRPFIERRSYHGHYVVTSKGRIARDLQKTYGDVLFNSDPDTVYSVEIKAEEENRTGNFFLETWSNLSLYTVGWMFTLNVDLLLYHFLREDLLYKIPFWPLRKWAFNIQRIYQYPEREQTKRAQMNDTWGRCVPIAVLTKELGLPAPFNPQRELSYWVTRISDSALAGSNPCAPPAIGASSQLCGVPDGIQRMKRRSE